MPIASLTFLGIELGTLAVGFILIAGIIALIAYTIKFVIISFNKLAESRYAPSRQELAQLARDASKSEYNQRLREMDLKQKKLNDTIEIIKTGKLPEVHAK